MNSTVVDPRRFDVYGPCRGRRRSPGGGVARLGSMILRASATGWPAPPKGAHISVMMHQMNRAPGTVSGERRWASARLVTE